MSDLADMTAELDGVRRTTKDDLAQWRYRGRLVARQLDDTHIVIRADFDYRDVLLRQFPTTFSVPTRFEKHMMVVADIGSADEGSIEDALVAARDLQRNADGKDPDPDPSCPPEPLPYGIVYRGGLESDRTVSRLSP